MKTLIVEDSATLCAIYAQYLDGSGLEVDSVETLSAARESLAKADVQLVLLDIELPDGNGLDLIDDLQQLSPQPAVVVMTGHGADYAEQAIARVLRTFLTNPSTRRGFGSPCSTPQRSKNSVSKSQTSR